MAAVVLDHEQRTTEFLQRIEDTISLVKDLKHEKQCSDEFVKEQQAELERLRSFVETQGQNEHDQPVPVDETKDDLRITEKYRGVVKHVCGDEITVDYEVNDDIVEHLYLRSQFRGGRLPKEGDCLEVTVVVSEVDAKEESLSSSDVNESPRNRTNLREVPDDF